MEWIKVTPETMPPDMEPVLVHLGNRLEVMVARYNRSLGIWETKSGFSYNSWIAITREPEEWIKRPWNIDRDPAED